PAGVHRSWLAGSWGHAETKAGRAVGLLMAPLELRVPSKWRLRRPQQEDRCWNAPGQTAAGTHPTTAKKTLCACVTTSSVGPSLTVYSSPSSSCQTRPAKCRC
ncbi:unnamed protein product, partial [Ectocarpus sp. 12 AP-2014]